jgi:PPIC-type PPIASE domain
MNKSFKSNTYFACALSLSLLLIPGCKWWSSDACCGDDSCASGVERPEDGSPVVATMENEPIITQASLEKEYQQLLQDQPQIAQMLPLLGGKEGLEERLVTALTDRNVLRRWVADNKIDTQDEYQKEYERVVATVTDMLNMKYFNKQNQVAVAEKQVKEFYDQNKTSMPELLVSQGGVKAVGIKFENKADADAFLKKAKEKKSDLQAAAKEAGLKDKVEDFRLVHAQSIGIAPALRDKICAIGKCPTLDVFKIDDKAYWVVKASAKEDPVYREYAQVKDQLKRFLEEKEREKVVTAQMDQLKKQYNVKIERAAAQQTEQVAQAEPQAEPIVDMVAQAEESVQGQQQAQAV